MSTSNKKKPPPASDESSDDFDEPAAKTKKKAKEHKAASTKKAPTDAEAPKKATASAPNEDFDDPEENLLDIPIPCKNFSGRDEGANLGRLMIKDIHVKNFKSYFGETSIGPFHKNFTAIIGPNGSGKSNVIDSLLFVFGFRSGKIRSKKISNLIHKSTGKTCDSCTVSISFQRIRDKSADDYEVVPGTGFTVSRTGYQNNSSTYSIDGRPVPLKVVEDTLKKCGIDLTHNRFLILQGEVEAISMMKAKGVNKNEEGMLEYLEDIIGSNRYEPLILKFEKRLDRLSMELSHQKAQREMARSVKVGLEPDVKNAVDYLSKENEVTMLKSKIEQRKRLKYMDKIAPIQKNIDEKKALLKESEEKLVNNKKGAKEAEQLEKDTTKEKSKIEKEFDKLKDEIEADSTSEKKRQQQVKRIKADIEKFEAEKAKEEKKKETLVDAPEKAAKKIERLKEESEDLKEIEKSANEKADKNMVEFDVKSAEYQGEKTETEAEFARLNKVFNEINGKTLIAQAEVEDMKKLASKGKTTLNELNQKLEEAQKKLEEEKEELETINQKLPGDEKTLKELTTEMPEVRATEQKLDREVRELKMKINEAEREQRSQATGNRVLETLMQEKRNGNLPGFLGRLGDLGAIDSKYDAAISTNCGMLSAYVCKDADSSAKAIDILSEKKLGRANFISIDKLERRQGMNKPANSFPVPRLFDLIKCEDSLKPVFYFVCGDLLAVSDLREAQRLDKLHNHRYNFATLNGDKLSMDGTITGGGQPRRGLIGTQVKVQTQSTNTEEVVKKMKEEVEIKQTKYKEAAEKSKRLDSLIFDLRQSVANLQQRLAVLKPSVEQAASRIETLKKTIEVQEVEAKKSHVNPKELEEKEEKLRKLIREKEEASNSAAEAKKKVEEVTEKIDAIFYEMVERFKKEAKESKDKWMSIEKTIAKETSTINNSERNIAKCAERIEQLEKDIEKRKNELESLNEAEIGNEEMQKKNDKLKEMDELLKQFDAKFKEIRENKNKLSKEELEIDKLNKQLETTIAELDANLKDKKKKVADIEEMVSKFKLNNIPRLAFLNITQRPEDMRAELDVEEEFERLGELDTDELNRISKVATADLADKAYSLEYQMRKKNEERKEEIEMDPGIDQCVILTEEELRAIGEREYEEITFRRKTYEQELETKKGQINFQVIKEYIAKVEKYNTEVEKTAKLTDDYSTHRARYLLLRKKRSIEFEDGYHIIAKSVREVYQMLTLGGDADLDYKSGSDPFSEGIQFLVRPPRKSWKIIENLSGGEKTLASLSLVFALHTFRPTPFYVMDEIDAALDYRNVTIIGHYVKERTRNAQFIIISLRNNMFELANRLIGIYKTDDCTRNVSIDPINICITAKALSERMGLTAITMPDEVTREFSARLKSARKEQTSKEKHYENFPSTSDIARAEAIVGIERKVRKVVDGSPSKRAASAASKEGERPGTQASNRPESRILERVKIPNVRLVHSTPPPEPEPVRTASSNSNHNTEAPEEADVSATSPPPAKKCHTDAAVAENNAELNKSGEENEEEEEEKDKMEVDANDETTKNETTSDAETTQT